MLFDEYPRDFVNVRSEVNSAPAPGTGSVETFADLQKFAELPAESFEQRSMQRHIAMERAMARMPVNQVVLRDGFALRQLTKGAGDGGERLNIFVDGSVVKGLQPLRFSNA